MYPTAVLAAAAVRSYNSSTRSNDIYPAALLRMTPSAPAAPRGGDAPMQAPQAAIPEATVQTVDTGGVVADGEDGPLEPRLVSKVCFTNKTNLHARLYILVMNQ